MSWGYSRIGRAETLAAKVRQQFVETGGCPKDSAEEAAKNAVGTIAEALCRSLAGNPVVKIEAMGSAWNQQDGTAKSQSISFKLETLAQFED